MSNKPSSTLSCTLVCIICVFGSQLYWGYLQAAYLCRNYTWRCQFFLYAFLKCASQTSLTAASRVLRVSRPASRVFTTETRCVWTSLCVNALFCRNDSLTGFADYLALIHHLFCIQNISKPRMLIFLFFLFWPSPYPSLNSPSLPDNSTSWLKHKIYYHSSIHFTCIFLSIKLTTSALS